MKLAEMIKLGMKGFKPSDIKQINESGMSTDEIISLAESGYSITEVNELISMAGNDESLQPGNEALTDQHGPADPAGNEGDKQTDEYKQQIADQNAELEKLKKTLEAVQNQNSRKNLGSADPEDSEKQLQEIFKNIY